MQELEVTVFKFASLSNPSPFSRGKKEITPIDMDGRVSVRFTHAGVIRTANVRAKDDWSVHLYEDGEDIYVCAYDEGRDTICVERFSLGSVPEARVLTGAERATVLGAGFATDDAKDLAEAVKAAGFA